MTPENIEAIKNALAPVADKIGHGAEFGWDVLVAGQFAEGVAQTGLGAMFLTVVFAIIYAAYKNHDYIVEETQYLGYIPVGIILFQLFLVATFFTMDLSQSSHQNTPRSSSLSV